MPASFPVSLFEEHSSVLPVWWETAQASPAVVYLDAHLDLQQTDEARITVLRDCRTVQEVRQLESPHHLNNAARYSYGIENFLYSALELGLIGRLIWVAPPHVPRTYSEALIEHVQQMDGVTFEELTGFDRVGTSSMRGKLLGLDITICGYEDLGNVDVPADYLLDVDVDYFVAVPGDRIWVDPATVLDAVTGQLGNPVAATVSRAVSSGFTPLHLRFLGDYVSALLAGEDRQIRHFSSLYSAVGALDASDSSRAAAACRRELEGWPGCPATHYLLAMALDDAEESRRLKDRAAALDEGYGFDLSREVSAFPNRRRSLSSAQLQELTVHLERMDPDAEGRALAEVAMGYLYATVGLVGDARRILDRQTGDLAGHGDLAFSIAMAILGHGQTDGVSGLLELARQLDKTRTGALLSLGDLAIRGGDARGALQLYREAEERAPAWMVPLQRQQLCHERLGEGQEAREIGRRIQDRTDVLSRRVAT